MKRDGQALTLPIASKTDDTYFTVTVPIEISDQFFGWICGFGKKAKITAPTRVEKQFKEYVDKRDR